MKAEIKNNELIVTIPINDPPKPSASGKTLVLASTRGNKPVNIGKQTVYIGLNAYVYPE